MRKAMFFHMLENLLGALGSCLDAMSAIILSIGLGFSTVPTAYAFLVAGIGMILTGQVSPACVPSELIILINSYSKDKRERSSMILFAGLTVLVLGATGIMGSIIDFIGPDILSAIMAGVGIMIFKVSIDLIREQPLPGIVSLISALIVYLTTGNLIYTVIICVACATVVWNIFKRDVILATPKVDLSQDTLSFVRPVFNLKVLRSTLGVVTLMLGEIISDGSITAQLAGITPDTNAMGLYIGAGNILNALFGGAPVSTIISGTGTAPNALLSGVFMMLFMTLLLLLKIIPRIKNYIPTQGLAGFLCVLATLVVFPGNAASALSSSPFVSAVTILVTGFVDPFIGACCGVVMRFILSLLA